MTKLVFVAVLRPEDRANRGPDDPFALYREVPWPFQVPKVGDSWWSFTLFPLGRFVRVREVIGLPPNVLRREWKYEVTFLVTEVEFQILEENDWREF